MKIIIPEDVQRRLDEQFRSFNNYAELSINYNHPTKQILAAISLDAVGLPLKQEYFSRGGTVTANAIIDILASLSPASQAIKTLGKHEAILAILNLLELDGRDALSEGSTVTASAWKMIAEKLCSFSETQLREVENIKKYHSPSSADRKLGRQGEKFVITYEKKRLIRAGLPDLAEKVEDVSRQNLGYDIYSFEISKLERRIEVKTTSLSLDYPFYLTRNELRASQIFRNSYWLYRVYDFNNNHGKIKCLRGDLSPILRLNPIQYSALKIDNIDWISP